MSDFKVGDKVMILSENQIGVVESMSTLYSDHSMEIIYHLTVGGKKLTRFFFEFELKGIQYIREERLKKILNGDRGEGNS